MYKKSYKVYKFISHLILNDLCFNMKKKKKIFLEQTD